MKSIKKKVLLGNFETMYDFLLRLRYNYRCKIFMRLLQGSCMTHSMTNKRFSDEWRRPWKGTQRKGSGTFAFASWARLIAIDGKIKATWNATATAIGKPHEIFRNDSVTRSKPEPTMFLSKRTVHVAPWLLFRLHKSLLFTWKSPRTAIFPRIS